MRRYTPVIVMLTLAACVLALCGRGPLVEVQPGGALYEKVTPENAASVLGADLGGEPAAARCDTGHRVPPCPRAARHAPRPLLRS